MNVIEIIDIDDDDEKSAPRQPSLSPKPLVVDDDIVLLDDDNDDATSSHISSPSKAQKRKHSPKRESSKALRRALSVKESQKDNSKSLCKSPTHILPHQASESPANLQDNSPTSNFALNPSSTDTKSKGKAKNSDKECTPRLQKFSQEQCTKTAADCKYPIPGVTLSELIFLVLRCESPLTSAQIWDYISGLFPYFEHHFDPHVGNLKVLRSIARNHSLFSRVPINKKVKLLMLGSLSHEEQSKIYSQIKRKISKISTAMYASENAQCFVDGILKFQQVRMFQLWERSNHDQKDATPTKGDSFSSSIAAPQSVSITDQLNIPIENLPLIPHSMAESLEDNEDFESSSDTILFSPKIVNFCSLKGTDDEVLLNPSSPPFSFDNSPEDSSLFDAGSLLNSDSLFKPQEMNGFANTVWSSDNSHQAELQIVEKASGSTAEVPSFPEVEKCLPRWMDIFKWISWNSEKRAIYCTYCDNIKVETAATQDKPVMEITNPDQIFKVSGTLRSHSERTSHKMAEVLKEKNMVTKIIFLVSFHFNEFDSLASITEAMEEFMGKSLSMFEDKLKCSIGVLGQYLERRILKSLNEVDLFSVITDPCQGILIVRWLNNNNEAEEHILASYISVMNMNPFEYLTKLGVQTSDLGYYISNTRCEDCCRCKNLPKPIFKTSSPLRLPLVGKFLSFLWRSKLLKPLYNVATALRNLWRKYPHKFFSLRSRLCFTDVSSFEARPRVIAKIFEFIDELKKIAQDIYTMSGALEALGFVSFDINYHKPACITELLPALSEVIDALIKNNNNYPFVYNEDELLQVLRRFKLRCCHIIDASKNLHNSDSMRPCDVDDLYEIVEISITEVIKPIYHKNRSTMIAYARMMRRSNIIKHNSNEKIQSTYNTLYSSLTPNFKYDSLQLLKELSSFLEQHPFVEKRQPSVALKLFNSDRKLAAVYPSVYEFYRHIGLFPLYSSSVTRTLYEVRIFCSQFRKTAWSSLGNNAMESILTILSELGGKSFLFRDRDLYEYWHEIADK